MIKVKNIHVHVGDFKLKDISFHIPSGSYAVLMGKTGCGKTTLLEIICGLIKPSSGTVLLNGDDVTYEPPANRQIGYIPQDTALFSHLSVRENIGFGLELRKWKQKDIDARVEALAEQLHIKDILTRRIHKLSGGEKQRVALGRALAFSPKILCLDEPLSALDHDTRESMCELLEEIKKSTGVTCLHITHDRNESLRLADITLQMENGLLIKD